MKNAKKLAQSILLVVAIAFVPNLSMAAQVEEKPGALTMVADLFVARPLGVLLVGLGTVTYVVSLPFSLAGGNALEAGETLVVGPARETFVRCLGCQRMGRKERIRD